MAKWFFLFPVCPWNGLCCQLLVACSTVVNIIKMEIVLVCFGSLKVSNYLQFLHLHLLGMAYYFKKNVQTPSSVRTPLSLYHIVSRLCTYNIDRTFHSADSLCPTHLTDQQKVYISSRPRAPWELNLCPCISTVMICQLNLQEHLTICFNVGTG